MSLALAIIGLLTSSGLIALLVKWLASRHEASKTDEYKLQKAVEKIDEAINKQDVDAVNSMLDNYLTNSELRDNKNKNNSGGQSSVANKS